MRKRLLDGLDPNRYTVVTYDLGYQIMPNGDIITSDGKPRDVDAVMLRQAEEIYGRKLEFRFRAPTPEEAKAMEPSATSLEHSFAQFQEKKS